MKKPEKSKIHKEIKDAYIKIPNIDEYGIDKVLEFMEEKIIDFKNAVYDIF